MAAVGTPADATRPSRPPRAAGVELPRGWALACCSDVHAGSAVPVAAGCKHVVAAGASQWTGPMPGMRRCRPKSPALTSAEGPLPSLPGQPLEGRSRQHGRRHLPHLCCQAACSDPDRAPAHAAAAPGAAAAAARAVAMPPQTLDHLQPVPRSWPSLPAGGAPFRPPFARAWRPPGRAWPPTHPAIQPQCQRAVAQTAGAQGAWAAAQRGSRARSPQPTCTLPAAAAPAALGTAWAAATAAAEAAAAAAGGCEAHRPRTCSIQGASSVRQANPRCTGRAPAPLPPRSTPAREARRAPGRSARPARPPGWQARPATCRPASVGTHGWTRPGVTRAPPRRSCRGRQHRGSYCSSVAQAGLDFQQWSSPQRGCTSACIEKRDLCQQRQHQPLAFEPVQRKEPASHAANYSRLQLFNRCIQTIGKTWTPPSHAAQLMAQATTDMVNLPAPRNDLCMCVGSRTSPVHCAPRSQQSCSLGAG
eukprot:354857-Chlamydomonas_euryale.AAC.2